MWALKILHEKNWRESLCSGTLSSTKFSLNSCSHSGISEFNGARPESANNGFPRSIVVSSSFVFWGFLVSLGVLVIGFTANNGFHRSIINIWTWHWRGINFPLILSFSSLALTWCCCNWWRRRAWGRCRMMPLVSWRCHWSWQAWSHDRNEVLRVALYPNPVFNEMWFLTVDPSIRISVFIAKLSKRQCCWRVFEDFHSQECVQFFDIHCSLFMRLHFSIGSYDYRRTTRFRQGIHFIIQVLVADHVHRLSGVYNKFSFLRFKNWCRQASIFRRWDECCFVFLL